MLKSLFSKKASGSLMVSRPDVEFGSEGIRYNAPTSTVQEWLDKPYAQGTSTDLGARLAQISSEGFGEAKSDHFLLGWEDVYQPHEAAPVCPYAVWLLAGASVRPAGFCCKGRCQRKATQVVTALAA